jgi:hypothetical protein
MSGLDLEKMNLFSKKTPKITQKPIEAMPATSKNLKKAIENFEDEEVIKSSSQSLHQPLKVNAPVMNIPRSQPFESKAKFDKFIPITTRISQEEYMELKGIENTIMRSRSKGNNINRERITFNSVMRCLVKNFLEKSDAIDFSEINNEQELNERIKKMLV